jgi:hypothetical protein
MDEMKEKTAKGLLLREIQQGYNRRFNLPLQGQVRSAYNDHGNMSMQSVDAIEGIRTDVY